MAHGYLEQGMTYQKSNSRVQTAAIPVVFSNICGHFMPGRDPNGDGGVSVLFVSPWGFEEYSSRRFFRNVGETLSVHNISSLRFDYPGTGDNLDFTDDDAGLQVWRDAVKTAAVELHKRTQYSRLVVFAQSFGAMLASEVFEELPGLHACVLVNPVLAGRHYLREVAVWSSVIANNLEIPEEHRDKSAGSIAGLKMPPGIALDVKNSIFRQIGAENTRKVLVAVPNVAAWSSLNPIVSKANQNIEVVEFPGFREMVANVTISQVPSDIVDELVSWIAKHKTDDVKQPRVLTVMEGKPELKGNGFVETPFRFGQAKNLSGVLCSASKSSVDTAVLFLTTAYERHASWGRMHTQLARMLATRGIVSMRFDAASVGDSADRAGAPGQILYSDWLELDVLEAIDYLESKGFKKVVLAARCSGGYAAFQAALRDDRIKGLVTVNQDAFFWPKGRPVDELLKFVPKDFHKYATKLFDFATLKRILRGEIQLTAALKNISLEVFRRCANAMEPYIIFDRAQSDAIQKTRKGFQLLARRKATISLLYAEGDLGLRAIDEVFLKSGKRVFEYENINFQIIPDCDHNLSRPHARAFYLESISDSVVKVSELQETKMVTERSVLAETVGAVFALFGSAMMMAQSKLGLIFDLS